MIINNPFPESSETLHLGNILTIPFTRKRTYWEWLTRKQPKKYLKQFIITETTSSEDCDEIFPR